MRADRMDMELWHVIRDWWAFAAFVVTGVVSYIAGRERQRFRIDDLGKKVDAQEKRLRMLEEQGRAEAITIAEIRTQQNGIMDILTEIRADIRRMRE